MAQLSRPTSVERFVVDEVMALCLGADRLSMICRVQPSVRQTWRHRGPPPEWQDSRMRRTFHRDPRSLAMLGSPYAMPPSC
ncbi:hypothetical protein L1887_47861 [Cichorium endivia]|nr:hypothetical protein L1887_47861 [Cichorium endivia]